MKKLLFIIAFLSLVASAIANDSIIKKNGNAVECKVVEVGTKEVFYSLPGKATPLYAIDIKDIETIIYEDGKQDHFISNSDKKSSASDEDSTEKIASQVKQIKWIMLGNAIVSISTILYALFY